MEQFQKTEQTKVKRQPKRGVYDKKTIYSILDEALVCHVGFVVDRQPYVIPTIHFRIGDRLYIHGSAASRMVRKTKEGIAACITVTLLDGLVLARSAFHHSTNYRSVVALGSLVEVVELEEKSAALEALVEHVVKGRWEDSRKPNAKEISATSVLAMDLKEVSAKIRTGPAVDEEEDYSLPYWAGVIPLTLYWSTRA